MPLLVIFSIVMGIFGGYLGRCLLLWHGANTYFDPMPTHITYFDFLTGVIKGFVFGVLIMTISCYKGLRTSGGAAGVGRVDDKQRRRHLLLHPLHQLLSYDRTQCPP